MNRNSAFKASLLVASMMSTHVFAASTVTFQGEVATQTCSISINSTTNAVVLMPTIPLSDLYTASTTTTAVGNSAGLTPFTISVTGCNPSNNAVTMYPEFLGTNVDTSTYALGNTASSDAANGVGIALYSDSTGMNQINLNGVTRGAAMTLAANSTSATVTYSAKYMATSATTTAGRVTGVAQYTLSYL